ncbi:MAG: hypothetical protein K6F14_02620 [Clostridiales bacterium]|nr:hypothetical protein [Clostridiales bacterium]
MEHIAINSFDELQSIQSGKLYKLECDIDCHNNKLSKLCSDFSGLIDGNGFIIKNLIIYESELFTDGQPISMFYTMKRSVVKNLRIENLKIEIPKSVYVPDVAALCTKASDTLFENVYVEAEAIGVEKLPLVYDSNNCEYVNVEVSKNMIFIKYN